MKTKTKTPAKKPARKPSKSAKATPSAPKSTEANPPASVSTIPPPRGKVTAITVLQKSTGQTFLVDIDSENNILLKRPDDSLMYMSSEDSDIIAEALLVRIANEMAAIGGGK